MKKLLLPALFAGMLGSISAQSIYIKADAGYAWPGFLKTQPITAFEPGLNPDPAYSSIIDMADRVETDSSLSKSPVKGSYSKGANVSFAVGYMVNPYFGVELGFTGLFGSNNKSTVHTDRNGLLGDGATINTQTKTNGLSLMPGIFIRAAKPEWKLAPVARIGLAIPLTGKTTHEIDITAPNSNLGNTKVNIGVDTKSKFSIGLNFQAGLAYQPHKMVQVFAVLTGQYLQVRGAKTTITKYNSSITKNGVESNADYLAKDGFLSNAVFGGGSTLSTYSKEVEFVDKLTPSSNTEEVGKVRADPNSPSPNEVNENKPRQELARSAPFSSVGLAVGVIVSFQVKKKKSKDTTTTITPAF
jgi:hypothetical protein